jgi:O-methyltransferase
MSAIPKSNRKAVRESALVRALQDASSTWVAQRPLAEIPSWLGRLHGIRVPRGVTKLADPTSYCGANINILITLLDRACALQGDLAECGVYRGGTLITTGIYLQQKRMTKVLYGFDSFEGFDGSVDSEIALGGSANPQKRRGGFGDTSARYVSDKVRRFRLEDQVKLVNGYMADTLRLHAQRKFCFVHLDVDIYESYKLALEFFFPRMADGGVILLDEYNDPPWPGCNKAVDEFLAGKTEQLQQIERDNHVKYFIEKQ